MRDIIWTVIMIWVVWKVYDTFKSMSKTKPQRANQSRYHQQEGEVKIDRNVNLKSHFNPDDGEYVDYEEVN
ncbi:MAG: DUF4834 family protein [Bacteroidetes bacterium]|nr:DUF4834 family protein [Bacteroidota bacterium]